MKSEAKFMREQLALVEKMERLKALRDAAEKEKEQAAKKEKGVSTERKTE